MCMCWCAREAAHACGACAAKQRGAQYLIALCAFASSRVGDALPGLAPAAGCSTLGNRGGYRSSVSWCLVPLIEICVPPAECCPNIRAARAHPGIGLRWPDGARLPIACIVHVMQASPLYKRSLTAGASTLLWASTTTPYKLSAQYLYPYVQPIADPALEKLAKSEYITMAVDYWKPAAQAAA